MRGVYLESQHKHMQKEWTENTIRYNDPVGMTGRRPDMPEFGAVIRDLKSKIDLSSESLTSILDVGCNNGYLMKNLSPKMCFLVGVDFCLEPMKHGKSLFPSMHFIQAQITNLPFVGQSFDRILCYNMYHYLPDVETGLRAAKELFRVLNKPGQLLIGDIFTSEHKHLIPESDIRQWNDPSRPFMHQMKNWLFMPIEVLKKSLVDLGAQVNILPQTGPLRCQGYRFDLLIEKG